jgi:ABC-type transport system involved in multi-copper enzyme maturation permease subunit
MAEGSTEKNSLKNTSITRFQDFKRERTHFSLVRENPDGTETPMKTLIWKEWREQRLFFLISVGIIVLSRIAVPVFFHEETLGKYVQYEDYANALAHFILPLLFSLFLGTISFTNEFTRNTMSFLLSQPVTAARFFWIKYLSALVLLLALVILSHLIFGVPFETISKEPVPILYLFLSIVILYSTACFSSLLLKNSLLAIICTPFILLFGFLLVFPLAVIPFLICPYLAIFILSTFSAIMATFLIYSFLTWQRAITRDVSIRKILFKTTVVILIISFGTHAIANLTAGIKLNNAIRQAKAEGMRLTLEEVIPPPVPDKDNAALVYQQAFALAERLKNKYKEEWGYMPYESTVEELTTEQKKTMSRIMKDPEFVRFYALLDRAVSMPACRFDINYEEGPAALLPHLDKMRSLARLIKARTYILAEEKRYTTALKSAETGLQVGNSLTYEPLLISQLVRVAVDTIVINSYRSLLSAQEGVISSDSCREIIEGIDRKDRQLTISIEGEPVIFSNDYNMESLYLNAGRRTSIKNRNFLKAYVIYVLMPMFKAESAFYMQAIMRLVDFAKQPYYLIKKPLSTWEKKIAPEAKMPPRYVLARMVLPAYGRTLAQQARYNATLDTFKLALALKIYKQQHGHYPDTLAPLAPEVIKELPLDPFTGKDYIYRRESKGFIVYSVGPNEKDNGGVYDPKQSTKYDDIAFKVIN